MAKRSSLWSTVEHELLAKAIQERGVGNPARPMTLALWSYISFSLKEQNYTRSPSACRKHFRRFECNQAIVYDAAGVQWTEPEMHILHSARKDRLSKQEKDLATSISANRMWETIVAALKNTGFERTCLECEALSIIADGFDLGRLAAYCREHRARSVAIIEVEDILTDEEGDEDDDYVCSVAEEQRVRDQISAQDPTYESEDSPLSDAMSSDCFTPDFQQGIYHSKYHCLSTDIATEDPSDVTPAPEKTKRHHFSNEELTILQKEVRQSGLSPSAFRRHELAMEIHTTDRIVHVCDLAPEQALVFNIYRNGLKTDVRSSTECLFSEPEITRQILASGVIEIFMMRRHRECALGKGTAPVQMGYRSLRVNHEQSLYPKLTL